MVEELSREIRKLGVRLERFVIVEEGFVQELQNCLDKFRVLNEILDQAKSDHDPEIIENVVDLKVTAIEALSETLKKESDTEHERSHLLESYGALVLALERAFKDLYPTK